MKGENDDSEKSPSMKVPPKRKGNSVNAENEQIAKPLNESPSEKEGK